jgi:hypothetical protein
MRPVTRCVAVLLGLVVAMAALPVAAGGHADEVFWRVNEARTERGLPPLARFPTQAQVILANDDYAATGDAHRVSSQNMAFYAGFGASAYAENQGAGSGGTSPARIVDAWIDSPAHAANMFSADATHLATAVTTEGGRTVYTIHLVTAPTVDASDPGPSRPAEPPPDDEPTSSADSDDAPAEPEEAPAPEPVEEADAGSVAVDLDELDPFREQLAIGEDARPADRLPPPDSDLEGSELPSQPVEEGPRAEPDDTVEIVSAGGAGNGPKELALTAGLIALTVLLLAVGGAVTHRRRQAAFRRSLRPRSRTPRGRSRRSARSAADATATTAAAAPTSNPMTTSDGQWTRR